MDDAMLTSSSDGANAGAAGTIDINADQRVDIADGSSISTSSNGSGIAGEIEVNAQSLSLTNLSRIDSATTAEDPAPEDPAPDAAPAPIMV